MGEAMTHDQLIAKIEASNFLEGHLLQKAVHAVAMLHQPKVESDLNDYLLCEECTQVSWKSEKWPCHTIEAILEVL